MKYTQCIVLKESEKAPGFWILAWAGNPFGIVNQEGETWGWHSQGEGGFHEGSTPTREEAIGKAFAKIQTLPGFENAELYRK